MRADRTKYREVENLSSGLSEPSLLPMRRTGQSGCVAENLLSSSAADSVPAVADRIFKLFPGPATPGLPVPAYFGLDHLPFTILKTRVGGTSSSVLIGGRILFISISAARVPRVKITPVIVVEIADCSGSARHRPISLREIG